ncbi:MAG: exosome complex RNA-binding protein Rrp4 [archaeon]
MGKLLVKDKEIVTPGEVIAEGMDYLPSFGTYRLGDKIMANRVGLLSVDGKVLKTLNMAGKYLPKPNDIIIGQVFDILMSGWRLKINSAYSAVLMMQEASFNFIQKGADLTRIYDLDDYIMTKITKVSSQKLIDVTMKGPGLRKLTDGRVIEVNTHKVPRIIGKQGSMVSMIKDATGCRISVGQNGLIWIQGEPENELVAVRAIQKIAEESHHPGLTESIKAFLEKNKLKNVPVVKHTEDNFSETTSETKFEPRKQETVKKFDRKKYDKPKAKNTGESK